VLLVEVDHQMGLRRIGAIQPEPHGTHAELADGDVLLLGVGDSSGKLEDKAVGMLRNFNRGRNCCTQSDFDANLAVGGKDFDLAHLSWTGFRGLSREHCPQGQERSQMN
jgi:hypothetical protein